jgi:chromosomal replication initiator protein
VGENEEVLWSKALDIIKAELNNEQVFGIWFKPIKPVLVKNGVITLEVPNKFFKTWLLDRYMGTLSSAISSAFGSDLKVDFTLGEKEEAGAEEENPKDPKQDKFFGIFTRHPQDHAKEIGLNSKYTFDNFVVGPSNRLAHAAALAVADSPAKTYNPLFIYGGVGLGKTHLMHAIGQRSLGKSAKTKVLYLSSETFTNQLISAIQTRATPEFRKKYRSVDILLIDDIQFIANKEATQEEFFHTFNALYDAHKQIVVSSDRPPKEIPGLEERLVSRFLYGLVADIQAPDLETRIAILKKKSEKATIVLPNDVLYFIAEKVKTNIRELEGALIRVVTYANLVDKTISVDLVKEVLKDMISEVEKKVTIDLIQKKVSEYFDIRLSDMRAKKRSKAIAYPRQIAMYIARQLTDYSLPEIGEFFGGRDHTTVIHACDKIIEDLKVKPGMRGLVDKLIQSIKE